MASYSNHMISSLSQLSDEYMFLPGVQEQQQQQYIPLELTLNDEHTRPASVHSSSSDEIVSSSDPLAEIMKLCGIPCEEAEQPEVSNTHIQPALTNDDRDQVPQPMPKLTRTPINMSIPTFLPETPKQPQPSQVPVMSSPAYVLPQTPSNMMPSTPLNSSIRTPEHHNISVYSQSSPAFETRLNDSFSLMFPPMQSSPMTPDSKPDLFSLMSAFPSLESMATPPLIPRASKPILMSNRIPVSDYKLPSALRDAIISDCKSDYVPMNLLQSVLPTHMDAIVSRERHLLTRFATLEREHPQSIREMRDFYKYQSAMIETERYQQLMKEQGSGKTHMKDLIDSHYDQQIHSIIDRVERSLQLFESTRWASQPSQTYQNSQLSYTYENRSEPGRILSHHRGIKPRPLLTRPSIKIMDDWYENNIEHPYPTTSTCAALAIAGGISIEQVKKWFANKRNRSANTRTLTEIAKVKRQRHFMYM